MSLAQGNNTPTRPRIESRSPDPESDALTTRPVRPKPRIENRYSTIKEQKKEAGVGGSGVNQELKALYDLKKDGLGSGGCDPRIEGIVQFKRGEGWGGC